MGKNICSKKVILLTVFVFITACTSISSDKTLISSFATKSKINNGFWVRGDIHVHSTGASNDTDNKSYPEDIKKVALERGLGFIMLNDHSNATGTGDNQGPEFPYWEKSQELTEPGRFVMVDGNEVSPWKNSKAPTGHVGCMPINFFTFDTTKPFIDKPVGSVTGGQAVEQVNKINGWPIVEHPYHITPWIEYDWTSMNYKAIEIWNSWFDKFDNKSISAWLCDVVQGKRTVAVGGSDCHRVYSSPYSEILNPALGFPRNAVYTNSLTWPGIVNGFINGKVIVHDPSAFAEYKVFDSSMQYLGMVGDRIKVKKRDTINFNISGFVKNLPVNGKIQLYGLKCNSCKDFRTPGMSLEPYVDKKVLFEQELPAGINKEFNLNYQKKADDYRFFYVEINQPLTLNSLLNKGFCITNVIDIESY